MPNKFVALQLITNTRLAPRPLIYSLASRFNASRRIRSMTTIANGAASPHHTPAHDEPKKLKILMLHGYTQSGPLFHAKTRALEKILHKAFPAQPPPPSTSPTATHNGAKHKRPPPKPTTTLPSYPGGLSLIYPTAPLLLHPADIPGFQVSETEGGETDAYGWWKRETGSELYTGLDQTLDLIAQTIQEAKGIDAIIGFSQGGALAALVISLLEPGRQKAFESNLSKNPNAIPYPKSFLPILPLCDIKFGISYSGFFCPHESYAAFYTPKIQTKFLNVIGSLDSVVEEGRSMALVDACEVGKGRLVIHPGGHFVPVNKEMAGVVVGWIRECCGEQVKEEENVEDMDVPF